jgi:hypothetical protein
MEARVCPPREFKLNSSPGVLLVAALRGRTFDNFHFGWQYGEFRRIFHHSTQIRIV